MTYSVTYTVTYWSKIGPLFFLKLIYIVYHVYIYNPICIKIVRQLSYEFKSLQTFGDPTKKIQNHDFYMIFFKMVLKVSIPHKEFFGKISKFDGIIFQGISFENWRRSRQPALVLHVLRLVLHVLRLVLHVLRLVLHVLCSSRFRVPPLPTSYRLPAKREALVVKKVKWVKWWSDAF